MTEVVDVGPRIAGRDAQPPAEDRILALLARFLQPDQDRATLRVITGGKGAEERACQ